jgi:hypothetical protein
VRKLKQVLLEIEGLINRANFQHEFLEIELQQKLDIIFENPYTFPTKDYNHLKKVLFMITGIEKSSNFGYYFYEQLQENPYPFCREVLKSAVYNERYYNLNDKALKSYIRAYMIESGFDSKAVLDFDEIIPEGHGYHYFDTFAQIDRIHNLYDFPIRPCFFDVIYAVLNRDTFPMTQKKATTIIGLLNLKQFLEPAIGKSIQIINSKELNSDKVLVMAHLVKLISILKHEPLSKQLNGQVYDLITCRCNGSLPKKFHTMEDDFKAFLNSQWQKTAVL